MLSAQDGDSSAFGAIYDVLADQIYRYIFYRVKNDEVEDLVEIVFLRAWEHIGKYKRGTFSFSSWLFRIAHNLVIDYYRGQEKPLNLEEDMEETLEDTTRERQPRHRMESKLNNEILKAALESLSKPYHDLIVLKFVNDLENGEIGKILGKNETAIRVMQFRALKELKKILSYYDFDV